LRRPRALAALALIRGEPFQPAGAGVDVLGAAGGEARVHVTEQGGVNRRAGNDGLALGQGGEFVEQVAARRVCTLTGLGFSDR
jgi:hypothetical protein